MKKIFWMSSHFWSFFFCQYSSHLQFQDFNSSPSYYNSNHLGCHFSLVFFKVSTISFYFLWRRFHSIKHSSWRPYSNAFMSGLNHESVGGKWVILSRERWLRLNSYWLKQYCSLKYWCVGYLVIFFKSMSFLSFIW